MRQNGVSENYEKKNKRRNVQDVTCKHGTKGYVLHV